MIHLVLVVSLVACAHGPDILLLLLCLLLSNCIIPLVLLLFLISYFRKILFSYISVQILHGIYNSISCVIDYAYVINSLKFLLLFLCFGKPLFYFNMEVFYLFFIAKAKRNPRSNRGFSNYKKDDIAVVSLFLLILLQIGLVCKVFLLVLLYYTLHMVCSFHRLFHRLNQFSSLIQPRLLTMLVFLFRHHI